MADIVVLDRVHLMPSEPDVAIIMYDSKLSDLYIYLLSAAETFLPL